MKKLNKNVLTGRDATILTITAQSILFTNEQIEPLLNILRDTKIEVQRIASAILNRDIFVVKGITKFDRTAAKTFQNWADNLGKNKITGPNRFDGVLKNANCKHWCARVQLLTQTAYKCQRQWYCFCQGCGLMDGR